MRYNTVRVVEFLVVYETISSCRLSLLHSLQYGFSFYSVYICTAVLILVFCFVFLHHDFATFSSYKSLTVQKCHIYSSMLCKTLPETL